MTIILGVDPGLNNTGWGVVAANGNHIKYVACGTIHTTTKTVISERLFHINQELIKVMALYQPDEFALEETYINKNAASSLKLGYVRGAIMLTAAQNGVNLTEYSATLVKKTVVGAGHADKDQISYMVNILLPGAEIGSEDAADALAVAICHHSHIRR